VRTESYSVNLPMMFMQPRYFDTWPTQVIDNHLPIGSCARNEVAVGAMRPLNIVYVQIVAMSGSVMLIMTVEFFSNVQSLGTRRSIDAHCFEYLSTCKNGMCSVLIDVECSDLGSYLGLEFGILGCERIIAAV
jgi:hypothetical protein